MPEKKCIFCDAPLTGRKSRDHPFPMWLLNHLGVCGEDVELTHIGYKKEPQNGLIHVVGEHVAEQRCHPMQAFVAGGVCGECNNGWMSDIEKRAKPVLTPLIDGERTLTQSRHDLPDSESFIVARWAVKTAYVIDRATPGAQTPTGFPLVSGSLWAISRPRPRSVGGVHPHGWASTSKMSAGMTRRRLIG